MRWLAVVACAACGSGKPPPADLSHHTQITPREGAPTIAWAERAFETKGLPAVARGGELAVVAVHDSDGGRGFPNLRLEAHDRVDKITEKLDVLFSSDYETLVDNDKPTPALDAKIAEGNRLLAELHGVHDLQPMRALELQPTTDDSDRHLAIGDGLDVDWNGDHLHVLLHNTNKSIVTMPTAKWLEPDHKPCPACDVCSNPAYMANVYKAPNIPLLVIEVAYHGSDTCWEPGNRFHVVTW